MDTIAASVLTISPAFWPVTLRLCRRTNHPEREVDDTNERVAYSAIGVGTFLICAGIAYASFVMALRLPRIELARPA
jgi:hypothetical protein